jgi:hypothetical protein
MADALWVLEKIRERRFIKAAPFDTTAFTDTGENMNLRPNAIKEKHYLRSRIPKFLLLIKAPVVLLHRFRKLLMGCYHRKNISYSIYTTTAHVRRNYHASDSNGIWKSRL